MSEIKSTIHTSQGLLAPLHKDRNAVYSQKIFLAQWHISASSTPQASSEMSSMTKQGTLKTLYYGAGEMLQWLRAYTAPAEDLSLVASTLGAL